MFAKICGITNREDALAAVDAGARALGFIFHAASPRCVTAAQIEPWVHEIPAEIWRVGVFVDESPETIERIAALLRLDVVQLHGSETPERVQGNPRGAGGPPHTPRVWKAVRVSEAQAFVPDFPEAEAILIDGLAYDWTRTAHFTRPLILAGGLDENNVKDRIRIAQPWAVDVASGIESSPGRKDHARMKKFIEAALSS